MSPSSMHRRDDSEDWVERVLDLHRRMQADASPFDKPVDGQVVWLPVGNVSPPHEVRDPPRLSRLVRSMRTGWVGRPLLVEPRSGAPGSYQSWTGSHRIAAARAAGLAALPCYVLDVAKVEALPGRSWYWEALARADNGTFVGEIEGNEERLHLAIDAGDELAAYLMILELQSDQERDAADPLPLLERAGVAIRRALRSRRGQAILARSPELCGAGWDEGGCVALAEALQRVLPGARLVGQGSDHFAGAGHYGALWHGAVFDATGAHDPARWGQGHLLTEPGQLGLQEGLAGSEQASREASELLYLLPEVLAAVAALGRQ